MRISEAFAKMVKKLMEEKKWSVADLVREAGMSRSGLVKILKAEYNQPSLKTAYKISQAFGVEYGRFLTQIREEFNKGNGHCE
jgi:transcriptional regulator with XRE-family HTH domain